MKHESRRGYMYHRIRLEELKFKIGLRVALSRFLFILAAVVSYLEPISKLPA
jgi:hypothetical protein